MNELVFRKVIIGYHEPLEGETSVYRPYSQDMPNWFVDWNSFPKEDISALQQEDMESFTTLLLCPKHNESQTGVLQQEQRYYMIQRICALTGTDHGQWSDFTDTQIIDLFIVICCEP